MKEKLQALVGILGFVVLFFGIPLAAYYWPADTKTTNGKTFDPYREYSEEHVYGDYAAQEEYEEQERQEHIAYEAKEAGAIDWEDAADHIGEYVTIFGTVEEVSQPGANGDPIFVDIGNAYPGDRVTGVCWSEYHSAFDDLFSYEGEPVLMEGTLYMNDGTPNIELTDSFQIKAL